MERVTMGADRYILTYTYGCWLQDSGTIVGKEIVGACPLLTAPVSPLPPSFTSVRVRTTRSLARSRPSLTASVPSVETTGEDSIKYATSGGQARSSQGIIPHAAFRLIFIWVIRKLRSCHEETR